MAGNRIGDSGPSDSGPSNHHQHVPYAALHGIHAHTNPIKQKGPAFDYGELEEATLMKLQGLKIRNDEAKGSLFTVAGRPGVTLELFPSSSTSLQQTPREMFLGSGSGAATGNISSGAAIFDKEYAKWLEEDHGHLLQLQAGLNTNLPETDLKSIVDGYISHYDEIFWLKTAAAKSDVFHLISGTWKTVAERCFLWIGGFRPSVLIKMLLCQLQPLTDQQLMAILSLQQVSEQEEEAISQGLEQLLQSLMRTIVIGDTQHMTAALHKLDCLESFACQADILRKEILHSLPQILTVRQIAQCYIVIGEFDGRLRALSSLWKSHSLDPNLSL